MEKVKFNKKKVLEWNKEQFKNIFMTKSILEATLEEINVEVLREGIDNQKIIK